MSWDPGNAHLLLGNQPLAITFSTTISRTIADLVIVN